MNLISIFFNIRNRASALFSLFLLFNLLLFIHCSINTAGTVDDTDTQIAFTGYVKDEENIGIEGVIAKIVGTSFVDTTDETGRYNIIVHLDTLSKYDIELDSLSKIEFTDDEKIIDTVEIENYQEEIPTIKLNRIIVTGKLITNQANFKLLQAIISGKPSGQNYSDTFNLNIDSVFSGFCAFSGSIYFKDDSKDTTYSIFLNVFDKDSLLVGKSPEVTFDSRTTSILIPNFDPYNALPSVEIIANDTAYVQETVLCKIIKSDSFDGFINKVEVSKEFSNIWNEIDSSDTTISIILPDSIIQYPVIVKVTDNDGNVVSDTLIINVIDSSYSVNALISDSYYDYDSLLLDANVDNKSVPISRWEWDIGNAGTFIETTPSSSVKFFKPDTSFSCIVKITDAWGFSKKDTLIIGTNTIAHWDFNTITNDTLFDLGPNDLHGFINLAQKVPGVRGEALKFVANDSSLVMVPKNTVLEPTILPFTIEGIIWGDSIQDCVNSVILRKAENVSNGYSFYWGNENDTITFDIDYHLVTVTDNVPSIERANKWNHIVIMIEDTATSLYVNGVLAQKESKSSNLLHSGDLFIGGGMFGLHRCFFNGKIDDFRLYSKAFSTDEILGRYNSLKLN